VIPKNVGEAEVWQAQMPLFGKKKTVLRGFF